MLSPTHRRDEDGSHLITPRAVVERARSRLGERSYRVLTSNCIGELPDSSMIAKHVGLIRQMLCASPAYLKKRGAPKTPLDLAMHDGVIHETYSMPNGWELVSKGVTQMMNVPSRLTVNLGEAAVAAAVAGAGIARVLSYLVEDLLRSRALVTLLEAYEPPSMPVSVVTRASVKCL